MKTRLSLALLFLGLPALCQAADDLPFPVFKAGKIGFVSSDGRLLAAPRYARTGSWSEGRIWAQEEDRDGARGVFLDERAAPLPTGEIRDLADVFHESPLPRFRDGVAAVGLPEGAFGYVDRAGRLLGRTSRTGVFMRQDDPLLLVVEQGKAGYIDRQGTMKIPPRFEKARPFRSGRAAAAEAGRWGLIDASGEWIARPAFDSILWFAEDSRVWRCRKGEKWGLLDRDGSALTDARFDAFGLVRGDVVSALADRTWGLVSIVGGIVVEPRYDWLQPLGDETDYWAVQSPSGRWGVVSTNGTERVPTVFDRIEALGPGVWAGSQNGEIGLLNPTNGQWRSETRYLSLAALPDPFRPLAWAMREGGRGVIDLLTEEVRVPFGHSQIQLWGALLAGQDGRHVRLYDKVGQVVREWEGSLDGLPEFEGLRDGAGVLRTTAGGTLIREDGTLPITNRFEEVGAWSAGLLAARRERRWGFVDGQGRWVVEPRFEALGAFSGTVAPAAEAGRWGLIDREGRWAAKPTFDKIGTAWNGRFPARRGEGWGLIDATGAEVLPCVYDGLEWGSDFRGDHLRYGSAAGRDAALPDGKVLGR